MITTKMVQNSKPLVFSLHREMWDWLAKNPSKTKKDWPKWNSEIQVCKCHCFLCEFSHVRGGCISCPVKWPSTSPSNPCIFSSSLEHQTGIIGEDFSTGLYYLWDCASDLNTLSKLARQIANLTPKF